MSLLKGPGCFVWEPGGHKKSRPPCRGSKMTIVGTKCDQGDGCHSHVAADMINLSHLDTSTNKNMATDVWPSSGAASNTPIPLPSLPLPPFHYLVFLALLYLSLSHSLPSPPLSCVLRLSVSPSHFPSPPLYCVPRRSLSLPLILILANLRSVSNIYLGQRKPDRLHCLKNSIPSIYSTQDYPLSFCKTQVPFFTFT